MSRHFYVQGNKWAVDAVTLVDGIERGTYTGKTLEELRVDYPTIEILTSDEVQDRIRKLAITKPEEITEERYIAMLEVLPPLAWVRRFGEASFHMSEFDVLDITGIYVCLRNRFFSFHDCYRLTHEERIARVREFFPDA